MFQKLGISTGRASQGQYAIAFGIYASVAFAANVAEDNAFLWFLTFAAWCWFIRMGARRARDTNTTGWAILFPLYWIVLFFKAPSYGANHYGNRDGVGLMPGFYNA